MHQIKHIGFTYVLGQNKKEKRGVALGITSDNQVYMRVSSLKNFFNVESKMFPMMYRAEYTNNQQWVQATEDVFEILKKNMKEDTMLSLMDKIETKALVIKRMLAAANGNGITHTIFNIMYGVVPNEGALLSLNAVLNQFDIAPADFYKSAVFEEIFGERRVFETVTFFDPRWDRMANIRGIDTRVLDVCVMISPLEYAVGLARDIKKKLIDRHGETFVRENKYI